MSIFSKKYLSKYSTTHSTKSVSKSRLKKVTDSHYLLAVSLIACALVTSGCQTIKPVAPHDSSSQIIKPTVLPKFNIRGKIGVTTPQNESKAAQSGSAFYVWAQDNNRFAIDLTGALGIGHTTIEYNGNTAKLVSEQTGEMSAASPEELLYKATGWSAPISQMPYWISGHPAPSDSKITQDSMGRLKTATNTNWLATFSYNAQDTLPNKIKVQRDDGHRVIMTIIHTQP